MIRRLGRDFRLLWAGQTISLADDQVATLTIPSIAILVLHSDGWQVGLLTAIGYIAYPLLGPFAGVAAAQLAGPALGTLPRRLTPAHLQGRTHAAARTVTHCAVPVGALTAGGLATIGTAVLGVRTGLAVVLLLSAVTSASAVWWLPAPSIGRLAHQPPATAAMGP